MLLTLLTTAALAAEVPAPDRPWAIADDEAFARRTALQLGLTGVAVSGVAVLFAAERRVTTPEIDPMERTGLRLLGFGALAAGLHLPTVTAYTWRSRRFAWSHVAGVLAVAPSLMLAGSALTWGNAEDPTLDAELGYALLLVGGAIGSVATHLPALIGVGAFHVDRRMSMTALVLPPAPQPAWTPQPTGYTPALGLTTRW